MCKCPFLSRCNCVIILSCLNKIIPAPQGMQKKNTNIFVLNAQALPPTYDVAHHVEGGGSWRREFYYKVIFCFTSSFMGLITSNNNVTLWIACTETLFIFTRFFSGTCLYRLLENLQQCNVLYEKNYITSDVSPTLNTARLIIISKQLLNNLPLGNRI